MEQQAIEALTAQIAELQNTVKDRPVQDPDLNWDAIKTDFADKIEALVALQVKAKLDSQPVRRIPGDFIGPDGETHRLEELKGNRYFGMLKNFRDDGYHKFFNSKVRPVDLWFANKMLEEQVRLQHAKIGGKAFGPSDDLQAALKALTSTGSATGDELVPTEMAAMLWDDIFLQSRVVSAMVTIPQPTNPFDVPLGLGAVTWRKGTENTATTVSDPATAKSTLTTTELVTEQNWSYTLDEDAVVAMAPAIRARLAQSGAEIIDDFALNADATNAGTGNINLDDADPDDDSYYLSDGQDGIRHQWLVDNTGQTIAAGGDALTDADFTGMLAKMGKNAVNPDQVVAVCDTSTYLNGFLKLSDVVTMEKFGNDAVIRTGQLAFYRGVPLIVSASHPLAEADGKVSTTAGNNTLGSVSAFNTQMWYAGFLRDLLIEVDRDIQKRQFIMVTSLREAVAAHGTRSSNTHTAGIANVLV
jgi:HK97 family phage major capsid protein